MCLSVCLSVRPQPLCYDLKCLTLPDDDDDAMMTKTLLCYYSVETRWYEGRAQTCIEFSRFVINLAFLRRPALIPRLYRMHAHMLQFHDHFPREPGLAVCSSSWILENYSLNLLVASATDLWVSGRCCLYVISDSSGRVAERVFAWFWDDNFCCRFFIFYLLVLILALWLLSSCCFMTHYFLGDRL